jgi:hypothetical protein
MWSMRLNKKGEAYLTYDAERRRTNQLRGSWEFIGHQGSDDIDHVVRVNEAAGYICLPDDENGVRILVLES